MISKCHWTHQSKINIRSSMHVRRNTLSPPSWLQKKIWMRSTNFRKKSSVCSRTHQWLDIRRTFGVEILLTLCSKKFLGSVRRNKRTADLHPTCDQTHTSFPSVPGMLLFAPLNSKWLSISFQSELDRRIENLAGNLCYPCEQTMTSSYHRSLLTTRALTSQMREPCTLKLRCQQQHVLDESGGRVRISRCLPDERGPARREVLWCADGSPGASARLIVDLMKHLWHREHHIQRASSPLEVKPFFWPLPFMASLSWRHPHKMQPLMTWHPLAYQMLSLTAPKWLACGCRGPLSARVVLNPWTLCILFAVKSFFCIKKAAPCASSISGDCVYVQGFLEQHFFFFDMLLLSPTKLCFWLWFFSNLFAVLSGPFDAFLLSPEHTRRVSFPLKLFSSIVSTTLAQDKDRYGHNELFMEELWNINAINAIPFSA